MERSKQQQGKPSQRRQEPQFAILPLPSEVRQVADNGNRCDNIGLWLDRFLTVNPQKNWEITQDAKHRKHLIHLANNKEWLCRMQKHLEAPLLIPLQHRLKALLQGIKVLLHPT